MNGHIVVTVLESVVCLIFLFVIFLKLVPALRLDCFRQDMFALRDEFFDYAASGKIGFNDPAYRLLRQSMNGFIRYGHNLTFFRTCMIAADTKLRMPDQKMIWSIKWDQALGNVKDEKVRAELIGFHSRVMELSLKRLLLGSPFLLSLFFVALILFGLQRGLMNLGGLFVDAANATVSKFVDPRVLEEQAALVAAA